MSSGSELSARILLTFGWDGRNGCDWKQRLKIFRISFRRFLLDVGEAGITFGSSDSSQNCKVTSSDSGGCNRGTGSDVFIVDGKLSVAIILLIIVA